MTIRYYPQVVQGSEEWAAMRCGLLTASEIKHIITPAKLQYAQNEKEKAHLYELLAQRITKFVEPRYISDDMLRGRDDEIDAKWLYTQNYAMIDDCGFITNDRWGFTLGYSPDGLVGEAGLIEVKGRRQKFQVETIIAGEMPNEFLIQVQTGLLVSERAWTDFVTFCGGMPMMTMRVYPDPVAQKAIESAATAFHEKLEKAIIHYTNTLAAAENRFLPTVRRPPESEITI